MNAIKHRLKQLRQDKGLTMMEFAQKISVSPGNVGDWESPSRTSIPGAKALIAIAQTFNVSLDWVLLGQSSTPSGYVQEKAGTAPENPQEEGLAVSKSWEKNSPDHAEKQNSLVMDSLISLASSLSTSDKQLLVELAARLHFLTHNNS